MPKPSSPVDSSDEAIEEVPEQLRIYRFNRVANMRPSLSTKTAWTADCPFCNRSGKLGLVVATSQYNCIVCGESGNNYTFVRAIHSQSMKETSRGDRAGAFKEFDLPGKPLPFAEVAEKWGMARHTLSGEWCFPGYNASGEITGLYIWRKVPVEKKGKTEWKYQLRCSPGLGHHLLGYEYVFGRKRKGREKSTVNKPSQVSVSRLPEFDVTEGWRDGVAWILETGRPTLAVPGTNSWREDWQPIVKGRTVNVLFDNDWPTKNPKTGDLRQLGGPAGVDRIGRMVHGSKAGQNGSAPGLLRFLNWGYDSDPPKDVNNPVLGVETGPASSDLYRSGVDLRDLTLKGPRSLVNAGKTVDTDNLLHIDEGPLEWVLGRLTTYPPERGVKLASGKLRSGETSETGGMTLLPRHCEEWNELIGVWKRAMKWRRELGDILAVMIATAISTKRVGDQLFLMVVGPPGSGKTRLCDAMLVSDFCYAIENLSGIISGWKSGHGGKDHSLLTRANGKCWITPEADTMVKAANYVSEMGKVRRAFDGKTTAAFKTLEEDRQYNDLRLTWIKAGTPAMLTRDLAGLGDRFLKIRISNPSFAAGLKIINHVALTAWNDVAEESEGERQMNPLHAEAYEKTAGYLDYLIDNVDELIKGIGLGDASYAEGIARMAYQVSYFRSRPDPDEEVEPVVEQPTRVVTQLMRYARCIAVVLNKTEIDDEVYRIVEKLADDSSKGVTLDVAEVLLERGSSSMKALEIYAKRPKEAVKKAVAWLTTIGVLELAGPMKRKRRGNTGQAAMWELSTLGKWMFGIDPDEEASDDNDEDGDDYQ